MALTDPTSWSDRLELFLQRACDCLEENTPLGAPTVIDVGTGQPVFNCYKIHSDEWPGDCCDALVLKVVRLYPVDRATGFPQPNSGSARNVRCGGITLAADVQLRLFRPCGVMAGGNNIAASLPSAADLDAEAESSLIDINALTCCLLCDPGFDDLTVQYNIAQATQFKSGDCYGWQINATIAMPGCSFTP